MIVLTIVCIKYKPAYSVTLAGEYLGTVENNEIVDNKLNRYLKDTSGNVAYREIHAYPEYECKLVSRSQEISDAEVFAKIESTIDTTYRYYAILVDGETKGILNSEEEANQIITEVKKDLDENVKFDIGLTEVYQKEVNTVDSKKVSENLNTIKLAKVDAYEKEKAAKARKIALAKAKTTIPTSGVSGAIQGMGLVTPVNGTLTSRFGSRSSVRSSSHTGIDLSTSRGTGIRAVAAGTVTYAAYRGSYGNLVIIDHGNGVESYYAHCNALYVSVGQRVDSNTTIAAVGSTRNSTGPHLHLELRVNGVPVNPQNYLY